MQRVVASLTLIGCIAAHPVALLGTEAAAAEPGVRACSLLTQELVLQVSPYEQQPAEERDHSRKLLTLIPPEEGSVGPSGTWCSYGGIHLQIDPFGAPTQTEKDIAKSSQRLPDLGDVAYFHDNRGEYAELYVRAGKRVLTIQMDTPQNRTPESVKPNAIALAKALLPKLQ